MNKLYIFNGPRLTEDQVNDIKLEAFGTINDDDMIISGKFTDDDEWFLDQLMNDKVNDNNVIFSGYDPEDHEIVPINISLDGQIAYLKDNISNEFDDEE